MSTTSNGPGLNLAASTLKCTTLLDPAALAAFTVPDGIPRIPLKLQVAGRTLTVSLNAKSLRKVVATIREAGSDGVVCVLQGKLIGDQIEEAGLSAMPKTPKPAAAIGQPSQQEAVP